ncbi:MAG TPA: SprT family zinc-dependent metalloprotease [Anaerovoracaceae bacterium]|nr:SprT family zinc-dependent metalloprotease [Anaerovoracaceae bacterium]
MVYNIEGIDITVIKKNIKHMYIRVKGEDVIVTVPNKTNEEYILGFIDSRMDWILKNRRTIIVNQIISGESHFVFGVPYVIKVEEDNKDDLELKNNLMLLKVKSLDKREKVLDKYYRKLLEAKLADEIPKCESITRIKADEWKIRKMKSRWGSCNTREKKITINLELAKMPIKCLDYIIIHELAHLYEPSHNARFKSLMDEFLPNWRIIKKETNSQKWK